MSLSHRTPYGGDPVFGNLFRFLDDFDSYSRGSLGNAKGHGRHGRQQFFSPRFDIRETEKTYELDGELPGIDKKDIIIEFTEPQTMVVRGRTEHTYSDGTPPTGLIEGTQTRGAITEGGDTSHSKESHRASHESHKESHTEKESATKEHFWYQERSVGEFHRTFTFPSSVDNSSVSANLNNGVLHITIPKATNHSNRRVTVN